MGISVIIADDHPLICKGFKQLVEESKFIKVVESAGTGEELLKMYFDYKPDVIVVDISMPIMDGLHAFKEIRKKDKNVRALFYSICGSKYEIFKTYDAGARGYICKNKDSADIINAIETIYNGELYFDDDFTRKDFLRFNESINGKDRRMEGKKLSKRESDILVQVAQGLTNKKIAQKLAISEKTVENHRRNIRLKFGLVGSQELVKYAIERNEKII